MACHAKMDMRGSSPSRFRLLRLIQRSTLSVLADEQKRTWCDLPWLRPPLANGSSAAGTRVTSMRRRRPAEIGRTWSRKRASLSNMRSTPGACFRQTSRPWTCAASTTEFNSRPEGRFVAIAWSAGLSWGQARVRKRPGFTLSGHQGEPFTEGRLREVNFAKRDCRHENQH